MKNKSTATSTTADAQILVDHLEGQNPQESVSPNNQCAGNAGPPVVVTPDEAVIAAQREVLGSTGGGQRTRGIGG